jgi:hypothetical protein
MFTFPTNRFTISLEGGESDAGLGVWGTKLPKTVAQSMKEFCTF